MPIFPTRSGLATGPVAVRVRRPRASDYAVEFVNRQLPQRFPRRSTSNPKDAIVFDIDGTLADVADLAQRHLTARTKDFDAFHRASEFAKPHEWVARAARSAYEDGTAVLIVTARMSDYLDLTVRWLMANWIQFDRIYMRASGDFRKDRQVKTEIIRQIRQDGFQIIHAWDDSPQIIELWGELNVPTTIVPGHLDVH